eukprot:Nitzschia sp. Nitz4//scaffold48_size128905//28270//29220//NITZ4_003585-RA/size128905-processed-gene-0.108-mRNA-1//-1//CDS//3329552937//6345//frame0
MLDTNSKYPQWHNTVAGAVSGCGARAVTAPLDLVRIRRQLDRNVTYPRPTIWQSFKSVVQNEGGPLALFRGGLAATYLWVGYATIQFSAYGNIKAFLRSKEDPSKALSSSTVSFLAGGSAGLCSTWITYPFDICRTTFAARGVATVVPPVEGGFQPPKSLLEFATKHYQQKGIQGFYAGVFPASVQIVPYMGLNFAIYEALTSGDRAVSWSAYAGTISGSTSKLVVYPLDTIKKRLQAQAVFGVGDGVKYEGMVDCMVKIATQEGIMSFYRGLLPSVLKTGLGSGLSFSIFRATKNLLEGFQDDWEERREHPARHR